MVAVTHVLVGLLAPKVSWAAPSFPAAGWIGAGSSGATGSSHVTLQAVSETVKSDALLGMELFEAHCAACHGPSGAGDGHLANRLPSPPAPFGGDPATYGSLRETYDAITQGRLDRMMPPFGDSLSDAERWALAAAVQTLRIGPERQVRGRLAFDSHCAECHTDAGSGLALRSADGRWSQSARRAAMDWSGAGALELVGGSRHPPVGAPGSDLRAAVDYLSTAAFDALPAEGLSTNGEIRGRVVLAPAGSGAAAVDVGAVSYALGLPGSVVTATTDADGGFQFDGVLAGPDVNVELVTEYEGVRYSTIVTPTVAGEPDGGAPTELNIYGTTTTAPLIAERAHLLLSPAPEAGVIRAVELWTIRNPLESTLVAKTDGATLRFLLPAGAVDARFGPGSPQAASQSGGPIAGGDAFELSTRSPVLPGATEVSFDYEVPYSEATFDWPVRSVLPAEEVNLAVIPADNVRMTSGDAESRTGDVGGQPVTALSLGAVRAGERREVSIDGLAQPLDSQAAVASRRSLPSSAALAAVAATFGVLAAAAFALGGTDSADRRRRRALEARRSAIVDQIVALDQDHVVGPRDAEHRAERAALLAEAVGIDVLLTQMADLGAHDQEDHP
jgi:mono/diheme cytochrome c family protein